MKKYLLILVVMFFSIYMFGCVKKEATEETQEQMSMETLGTVNTAAPVTPEVKVSEPKIQTTPAAPAKAPKLEPLPPAGPYKPSAVEIQTALKNAGFYTAAVDGKIGPITKKAIEEFQKANNLKVDGKVGLKTWAALEKYLNPAPVSAAPAKKR